MNKGDYCNQSIMYEILHTSSYKKKHFYYLVPERKLPMNLRTDVAFKFFDENQRAKRLIGLNFRSFFSEYRDVCRSPGNLNYNRNYFTSFFQPYRCSGCCSSFFRSRSVVLLAASKGFQFFLFENVSEYL